MRITEKEYPQSYYGLMAVLTLGPQTGYDIRKVLEGPEIFYWKESYGNIYPMLRSLEHDGLVDRTDSYVKKKKRVIYQLNQAGWEVLSKWMMEPVKLSRFRVEILMKLRFGESCGVANMIKHISDYRATAERELHEAQEASRNIKDEGESLSGDLRLLTSLFMEELKKSTLRWCDDSLKILSKWREREAGNDQSDAPFPESADPTATSVGIVTVPARYLPLIE